MEQAILQAIFQRFYQFQHLYFKEILTNFAHSTGSVLINSTVGILGFLNPAEKMGFKIK